MKKILGFIIPVIFLGLSVFVMVSSPILKKPFGKDDDLNGIIYAIKDDIENDNWDNAKEKAYNLEEAWKIISKRVQFSAERNELMNGNRCIARFKGYIEANDKAGAYAELNELQEHWNDIGQ